MIKLKHLLTEIDDEKEMVKDIKIEEKKIITSDPEIKKVIKTVVKKPAAI